MTKNEIAEALSEIATLLELKGENPFKIRAYQTGARALEGVEEGELTRLVEAGELQSVKGIGEALAQKISELRRTGRLEFLEKLRAAVPPGLVEMLQIPGLGPKKILALHGKLGIADLAGLTAACGDGRVAALPGFGEKTQEKLLAYEAGFKLPLADNRLHVNASAFYYDYKDKQIRGLVIDPVFNQLEKLVNVPKSRINGAEVEITARPVSGLTLREL